MSDANQTTNLEQFPDSAIEVVHGKVQRLNRIAMHRFPELRSGMELPGFLSTPLKDPDGAGTFTHQGVLYLFSRVAGTAGSLLLVRPAPKSGLTDRQLDGFVRQMRGRPACTGSGAVLRPPEAERRPPPSAGGTGLPDPA